MNCVPYHLPIGSKVVACSGFSKLRKRQNYLYCPGPSTFPVNSEDQLVLLSDLAALKSRLETATADRLRVLISGVL